ncbi:MAG: tRNA pseudouridine(55) synthase TruB, partial [Mariprofundaceae bacterium]|nr:tRNA pseudouridine(55) synthase TruB [Mariprofundaceae bacterium]
TLDPLATGMLPIMVGEATRFSAVGLEADKSYRVSFDLSYQTDTLDGEGKETARFTVDQTEASVQAVLAQFTGEIEQVPPAYSAIHVDGRRAHEIAREGGEVEIPSRQVTINELKLISYEAPLVTLDVECSKGTYVRSLARDIGAALACGGCVTELRRLSTAGWPEVIMVTPEQLKAAPEACLLPLSQWLRHLPRLRLHAEQALRYAQGQRIQLTRGDEGEVAVFCRATDVGAAEEDDILLGTAEIRPGIERMILHPRRVLPSAMSRVQAVLAG